MNINREVGVPRAYGKEFRKIGPVKLEKRHNVVAT